MPMPWEQDYGGAAQAPAAGQAKPWEQDYAPANKDEDTGTFLHPKKPTGKGMGAVWERIKQYPGLALGQITDAGETLGKVAHGELDATSPEAIKAATDIGMTTVGGPLGSRAPVIGTGAQIARRAGVGKIQPGEATPGVKPPSPGMEAAETATDLGAPLPAGLASDSRATQALTQASRSMPIVGAKIDERVGNTIDKAGGAVNEIAESLSGGVPDRATAGAQLRPSLQGVISDNNGKIDQAYQSLRHVIDPDAVSPVPRTAAALKGIIGERIAARMQKPESGLQDIIKLTNNGAGFNGLQRARADVGKIVGLASNNPNPGFNVGDFKRLYAAMSGDMENTVRANARGVHPDVAANVLREANRVADTLVDRNKNMQRLLDIRSDENVVGGVLNAARGKSGNVRLLAQLRAQMPKQDFEQIVGVGLSEMGHNPATNKFSLEKFGTSWRNLGDTAKSVLFPDPAHRKALEDIAHLDTILKASDKYINKSQTGRVDTLTKVIGGAGAAAGAVASGNVPALLAGLAGGAGGYGLAKYLARPATASALRKWATVAADKQQGGRWGVGKAALLGIAGRNLMTNLRDMPGFSGGGSATPAAVPAKPMPLPRAAPRRTIQDRMPAA